MKNHTKDNTPKDCYWVALTDTEYATENLQFTMKQQVGDTKETETIAIVLEDFPMASEFPGGTDWQDDEGNEVTNPYYEMALKYMKDHEIAARRRKGERTFITLARPNAEKRGPVLPSEATLRKQWIARRVKDKGISPEAAAEQYDSFNS